MAAAIPFIAAGISAYGQIQQGRQASAAASQNAALAKQQATSALQQGVSQEDALRRQQAAFNGEARAQTAQSGTGFGGSNLDVARQNAALQQLDLLNTRYNAQLEASGLLAQASQDEAAAKNAKSNSLIAAAGTAASAYGDYTKNKSVLARQRKGYGG